MSRSRLGVALPVCALLALGLLVACSPADEGARAVSPETDARESPPTNPAPAGDRAEALTRLAANVGDYWAKARLIRVGPPALPFLLAQVESGEDPLVVESIGTARWLVQRWKDRPEAAEILSAELIEFTRRPIAAERKDFAVDLLGDLGGAQTVGRLVELLPDPDLGPTATLALGRIEGEAARVALLEETERSAENRALAYALLGRRAEAESLPALLEAASSDTDALAALAAFDDPAASDWLFEAAADGSSAAVDALLHSERAAEGATVDGASLARLVRSTSGETLRRVLDGIRAPEQHHPDLETALLDLSPRGATGRARAAALLSLADRLEPSVSASVALETLDRHSDPQLLVPALRVCARTCGAEAAGTIGETLDSRDPTVRMGAIQALAMLPGTEASSALQSAIGRADSTTAGAMLTALSRRRDPVAVQAMLALMAEADPDLRDPLLVAALAMAPELRNSRHAAQIWARSLDLELTLEALRGLERTAGGAEISRLTEVLTTTSGETYDAARAALVATGRRLADAGEREMAVTALTTALDAGASVGADLRRVGERVELVAHGGRIDAWWRWVAPEASAPPTPCQQSEPPLEALGALLTSDDVTGWRSIDAGSSRRAIEVERAQAGPETPIWLAAGVLPRAAVPVGLVVESTARIDLWLGGRALAPEPDEDDPQVRRYRADLAEGENGLLLRLCGGEARVSLDLRLEDESGRPLKFRIR